MKRSRCWQETASRNREDTGTGPGGSLTPSCVRIRLPLPLGQQPVGVDQRGSTTKRWLVANPVQELELAVGGWRRGRSRRVAVPPVSRRPAPAPARRWRRRRPEAARAGSRPPRRRCTAWCGRRPSAPSPQADPGARTRAAPAEGCAAEVTAVRGQQRTMLVTQQGLDRRPRRHVDRLRAQAGQRPCERGEVRHRFGKVATAQQQVDQPRVQRVADQMMDVVRSTRCCARSARAWSSQRRRKLRWLRRSWSTDGRTCARPDRRSLGRHAASSRARRAAAVARWTGRARRAGTKSAPSASAGLIAA